MTAVGTAVKTLDGTPASPRDAIPSFTTALAKHFPGAAKEAAFVDACASVLNKAGFREDNSIACVGICRDEICGSLMTEVQSKFGESFGFRGLGGFIFAGKTGFGAAHAHCPANPDGRHKYVYIVAPHIGIGQDGKLGSCNRAGIGHTSTACGALAAFHGGLSSGSVSPQLAMDDLEMSAMSALLLQSIPWGTVPDLAELTKIAARIIAEKQVAAAIAATVDPAKADYAMITGIQIHGPGLQQTYIMPIADLCYAVVDGEKTMLSIPEAVAPLVKEVVMKAPFDGV
ncbi:low-co2 inducible protein lcib [Tribonema minus]|uniref:Low-co2 inducible protein lcib n=1 Tax=Tribonema minus TaxID=303371 RepID=A0A836CN60_9STRA|nr:low-co2 inducible protein lcib [Tribonema minus]